MKTRILFCTLMLGCSISSLSAWGQHTFEQTRTVDPSGNADFTTIQSAINDIVDNPSVKWTVLVYAGVYAENIILDGEDENIDIVGVDADSVIIRPSADGTGIKIISGAETERNNTIRNLTIDTTTSTNGGHGIEIVKGAGGGDSTPKNINVEGVIINAAGTDKKGILGIDADTVQIVNCQLTSTGGHAVDAGDNFQVLNSTTISTADDKIGINLLSRSGLFVSGCQITGGKRAIFIGVSTGEGSCSDVEIANSVILGINDATNQSTEGVSLYAPGNNVLFQNCLIRAEKVSGTGNHAMGIWADWDEVETTMDPVFDNCAIHARGGSSMTSVRGIQVDNTNVVQLLNCSIRSECSNTSEAVQVYGVYCPSVSIKLNGGSIETSGFGDNAQQIFDLVGDADGSPSANHIFVSGVRFSKWLGQINASGGAQNITQIVNNVATADNDAILLETTLAATATNKTPDAQPDVYRVLSVTGNLAGMTQDVVIDGTNWAGDRIVEKITLNGTATVIGKRPFASVTKIVLPARITVNEKVKVGTSNLLGLYYPISSTSEVLQQARASSVTSAYAFETVGTVDAVYATVDVGGTLQSGDSLQWLLITAK